MSDNEVVLLADSSNGALTTVRRGRVLMNGDHWTLARDAAHVAEILHANGVPRTAKRGRVMSELNLAGYWPTKAALNDYIKESKEINA